MLNKRFLLLIIILLAITLFSTGCANKINEKIGEKVIEKGFEKALGEDIDINTKDNSLSISTGDVDLQIGGDLQWPKTKMDPLPKPNAKVVSVTDQTMDQSTTVTVHFPNHKDPFDYLQKVKDLGYIEASTTESDGFYSYMGYGTDNSQVVINTMGLDDLTLGIITLVKDSDYAKEFFIKENDPLAELDLADVDMTDDVPWPKDQMDNIPELPGKIIGVTTSQDSVYIELEYVKKEDVYTFIEDIKKLGFNVSTSEVISSDNILYMSLDDRDYGLSIRWYGTGANINYTK